FNMLEWLDCALFLDFDGTLVELAPTPDEVVVAPELVEALRVIRARLDGRLAIVSGRPIAQIDALLAPLTLPVAGVHGMERRDAGGMLHYAPIHSFPVRLCERWKWRPHPQDYRADKKREPLHLPHRM